MGPILFFDGRCALCHRSVRWLIKHDTKEQLRFVTQSNKHIAEFLHQQGLYLPTSNSLWLLHQNKLYEYSDAVLYSLPFLNAPWRYLFVLRFIPKAIRDSVYKWIATHRYRWFGQYAHCPLPAPKHQHRFLFSENETFL
jgi:predicted DCC family thiol-disulfide oxidoreductase YuxK